MKLGYIRKALVALAACAALGALAAPAATATSVPEVGYERFTGCPHPGEMVTISICFDEVFENGELKLGNISIPISTPFTLSGGQTPAGSFHFNGFGGLELVKQKVPGGIIGFTGLPWLAGSLPPQDLVLYAQIELAGNPGDQLADPATLPIKVRFINPVLGTKCYVGSNANPIHLNLTTGTTNPPAPAKPITGKAGEASSTEGSIERIAGGTHVDNSFAVPGANGCVLTLFGYLPISLNGPINTQSALPSAAGKNQAILGFETEYAGVELVYP